MKNPVTYYLFKKKYGSVRLLKPLRCVLEHTGVGDASATMLVGRLLGKERVVCGPSTGLSGGGCRVQIPVDRGKNVL